MPRRNFLWLILLAAASLVCYQRVQQSRYGRVVTEAIDVIRQRYLDPIDEQALFEGAMEGMVGRLDDYSAYISPKMLQEFEESIDQQFGGVGMEVTLDPKTRQLMVLSPLVGTPAYEAGIRAGDRILRIAGHSTQGLSLEDAVGRLRGKPGQPVTLTLLHEGEQKPVEITVVRAVIHIDTVVGDTRNPDGSWNFSLEGHPQIGYVRVNAFAEKTVDELRLVLKRLAADGMEGLVLDLRNDPGGLLDAAVGVCDLLIDQGVIVTTRRRGNQIRETIEAAPDGSFTGFPAAVLVNQYSASASEIVAACLQDHRRAVVVGQRTFGKGTVQEIIDLADRRGALKLTTASYWRPSGQNIHRRRDAGEDEPWGVVPDEGYRVVVEGEELARLRQWRLRRDVYQPAAGSPRNGEPPEPMVDRQLAKAVEYVEQQIAKRP